VNTTKNVASQQNRPMVIARVTTSPNSGTTQTQWWVQEIGLMSSPSPALTSKAGSRAPSAARRRITGTVTASSTSPSPTATGRAQPARPETRWSKPFNDWLATWVLDVAGFVLNSGPPSTCVVQYRIESAGSRIRLSAPSPTNVHSARSASARRPVMNRCSTKISGVSLIAAATPTSTPRLGDGGSTRTSSTTKAISKASI
jgi:hypothetical protein